MTNKVKKQSLLGATSPRQVKKLKPSVPKKAPELTLSKQAPESSTPVVAQKKKLPASAKWLALAVVTLLMILFPKPKLLTYQKLDIVSQSIYWPGGLGLEPKLMDSNLHPMFNPAQNRLYLCLDKKRPETCQQYQVIAEEGFFAVLFSLFAN